MRKENEKHLASLRLCAFALRSRSMATTVKAAAVRWLASKFGETGNPVCASKLYILEKSWTRRSAWWFEIPQRAIETPKSEEINLLCEVTPGASEFYFLKVPVEFFKKELPKLCVRKNGKVSLFLSAEPEEIFIEQRGSGKIGFGHFLMPS